MDKKTIKFPKYFSHRHFDYVVKQYKELLSIINSRAYEIIFDVSNTEHVSVLGTLLIAQMSDVLTTKKCKCYVHYGKDSFMAKLFAMMGLVKNDTYKEIETYLDRFRVKVERCSNGQESLNAVNKLIPIIINEFKPSESVLRAINWALWELVDNAGVHGYGTYSNDFNASYLRPVYFCAFDYQDVLDIAILDTGQGIHNSFLSSGKEQYKGISNEQALRLCIQNTESGHPKGSPGLGLFGCAEIAKQSNGELTIISGHNKLSLIKKELNIFPVAKLDGTMVLLSIPQNINLDLGRILGADSLTVTEPIEDLFGEFHE